MKKARLLEDHFPFRFSSEIKKRSVNTFRLILTTYGRISLIKPTKRSHRRTFWVLCMIEIWFCLCMCTATIPRVEYTTEEQFSKNQTESSYYQYAPWIQISLVQQLWGLPVFEHLLHNFYLLLMKSNYPYYQTLIKTQARLVRVPTLFLIEVNYLRLR